MLIEKSVFNFHEVGEKSLDDIKHECLEHFARLLKYALISNTEEIMRNFKIRVDDDYKGSTLNYRAFEMLMGAHPIKFNSKNIVFEEMLNNNPGPFSVECTCADMYELEYVEGTEETSSFYKFNVTQYDNPKGNCTCETECSCACECPENKRPNSAEYIRNFNKAFGVGEFPFMTITIIRLGNKDHYFYNIHR